MTFSEKLLFLRKQKGLTQEELAEMLDVSRQSVSKWEAQQTLPEPNKIILISEIFDVSIDWLLKDHLSVEHQQNNNVTSTDVTMPEEEREIVETVVSGAKQEMIFCSKCGKKNSADSIFCGYCGKQFTFVEPHAMNAGKLSKDDFDFAYYKINLQAQQQALQMQKQELEEAREQTRQQQEQTKLQKKQYKKMRKCPRCGSTSLSGNKKGYGIGKGVVGAAVAGPLGLVAGNIGSKKVIVTCMNCGKKFKI